MHQTQTERCPCGGGTYVNCCGRWHAGEPAPTPEALMRARYTAYTRCEEKYLLDTWHSSQRPASVKFDAGVKWLGLKILAAPVPAAGRAEVEFIARYRIGGASAVRLHERSRFVAEGDRWFYVDGVQFEE